MDRKDIDKSLKWDTEKNLQNRRRILQRSRRSKKLNRKN